MKSQKSFPVALLLTLIPGLGLGVVTVDIFEAGTDVFFRVSGGVNLSGLSSSVTLNDGTTPQMTGGPSSSIVLEGASATLPLYTGAAATVAQFTTGPVGLSGLLGATLPTVGITDTGGVFVSPSLDGAPATQVTIGLIFGESLASLGIADGVISSTSWNTGSGTETIRFRTGSAVVVAPEPSSALLMLLGAGGLVIRRRRLPIRNAP